MGATSLMKEQQKQSDGKTGKRRKQTFVCRLSLSGQEKGDFRVKKNSEAAPAFMWIHRTLSSRTL